MSLQPEHEHHLVSKDFVASTVLENLVSIRTRMIDKQEFECAYAAKAGIDLITALRADLAAARAEAERAKARLAEVERDLREADKTIGKVWVALERVTYQSAEGMTIWECVEKDHKQLAALSSECEALKADKARDLESDSIVASCNCLTKTNETKYHKPGCKYRLICERDAAKGLISALGSDLVEIQRIAAFDLSSDVADRIFQYCKRPLAAIDAARAAGTGGGHD